MFYLNFKSRALVEVPNIELVGSTIASLKDFSRTVYFLELLVVIPIFVAFLYCRQRLRSLS